MIANNRKLFFLSAIVLLTITGAVVFVTSRGQATGQATAQIGFWPPFTMIYEVQGPVWNDVTVNEVHRLEYRSRSDWTDTVIESDPIESLGVGTVTTAGSYQRVKGTRYEEFDVTDNELNVGETEENTMRVPNGFLILLPPAADLEKLQGGKLAQAATDAKVCYREECKENAPGFVFMLGKQDRVFANDSRWSIPLRVGDLFVARELRIDAAKQ